MSRYNLTGLLKEDYINIDRSKFDEIVNRFAEEGYRYLPMNPKFSYTSNHAILMWLEDNFEDGTKAYTVRPLVNSQGDTYGGLIYVIPDESVFVIDDATDDDLDDLRDAGQLNEYGSLKNLLKETHIGRETFESIVDFFAEEGYTYYPLDRKAVGYYRTSILQWLEEQAGDNVKAFTIVPKKKSSGDVTGITIYAMPGERYLYFNNATEDDVDDIIDAGKLNEDAPLGKAWWRNVDWASDFRAESLAVVLAEMGAEYVPEEDIDLPNKEKYDGDENGYADDSAYELKIHAKSKGAENLLFSIIEIGSDVFFISSDEFNYDLWEFSADDIQDVIDAGSLNENLKENTGKWDDGIAWGTSEATEEAINRIAEMGAVFIDDLDFDPGEMNQEDTNIYFADVADFMQQKYGDDTLYYAFEDFNDGNRTERAFVFSDGEHANTWYWSDEEIEDFKEAGQLSENQSITEDMSEDPKIGDLLATYADENLRIISPDKSMSIVQDFSDFGSDMHKYGSKFDLSQIRYDDQFRKLTPPAIVEYIEDMYDSDYVMAGDEVAVDNFLYERPEMQQEFAGFEDELTPELMIDAGFPEEAKELEQYINDERDFRVNDDHLYRVSSGIGFDSEGKLVQQAMHVLEDYHDNTILIEQKLEKEYDVSDINDVAEALKSFRSELEDLILNQGDTTITYEPDFKESKNMINENSDLKAEEFISYVADWPLHYVDIPPDVEDEWVSDLMMYGTPEREEIDDYLSDEVPKYLEGLDRKAGFEEDEDEGYFTFLDWSFYEKLDLFIDSSQIEVYLGSGYYDTYEMSPQQVDDMIEAGELYKENLSEQVDVLEKNDSYNPTMKDIQDTGIFDYVDEKFGDIGYGYDRGEINSDIRHESQRPGANYFDNGQYEAFIWTAADNLINYRMPTPEMDKVVEKIYEEVYQEEVVATINDSFESEYPEIYYEQGGDPEELTPDALENTSRELEEVGEVERAKEYDEASDWLRDKVWDYFYENSRNNMDIFLDIFYYNRDNDDAIDGKPTMKIQTGLSSEVGTIGMEKFEFTFEGNQELESEMEKAMKQVEDYWD